MLLIARLLYDKGVGEFAEAARLLKQQGIAVDCRLLGFLDVVNKTAVSAATVREWVNQGIVTYCGSAEDVRPHIAAADVVVLPSYREGTPRSLLEAAAMGKPLIATDVPGCREVIEPGISGLLCRPRDAADLARVMGEMATMPADERAAMGAAGRARMVAKFDETLVIRRYLRALESIIPRPASALAARALL
jgi:glycosyltransferase involved in cell wall biosynthesis